MMVEISQNREHRIFPLLMKLACAVITKRKIPYIRDIIYQRMLCDGMSEISLDAILISNYSFHNYICLHYD